MSVRLYVGGDAQNVQRRRLNLTGYRCFSGAYGPKSRFTAAEAAKVVGLHDLHPIPERERDADGCYVNRVDGDPAA